MLGKNYKQKSEFYAELSTLLKSGISILESLEILKENVDGLGNFNDIKNLENVIKDISKKGLSLTDALNKIKSIPQFELMMIKKGEEVGSLPRALDSLSEKYILKYNTVTHIKQGLVKPGIMFLALLVLPRLPELVSGKISLFEYIATAGIILSVFFGLLFICLKIYRDMGKLRNSAILRDKFIAKIPLAGKLCELINYEAFFTTLAMMLGAGVSIQETLKSCLKTTTNQNLINGIKVIQKSIDKGKGLAESFEDTRLFSKKVIYQLRVAEVAGTLDISCNKIGKTYTNKILTISNRLVEWIPRIVYVIAMVFSVYYLLEGMQSRMDILDKIDADM